MVYLLQIYLMVLFGPRFIIYNNIYHFVVLNFDLWSIGKSINLENNLQIQYTMLTFNLMKLDKNHTLKKKLFEITKKGIYKIEENYRDMFWIKTKLITLYHKKIYYMICNLTCGT